MENGWLAFKGEDLDNRAKVASRRCGHIAAAIILCGALVFAGTRLYEHSFSREGPDFLERTGEEQDVSLKLELAYKGISVERDVQITVKPQRISYEKAQDMFDECEDWLREQLSEGPVFPAEAPNGTVITWQDEDFSYLEQENASDVQLIAQLSAGEYFRVSAFTVPLDPGSEEYAQSLAKLAEKLENDYPEVQYVNRLMTHSWGQRVIRFYDPDGNLIEVGTPM